MPITGPQQFNLEPLPPAPPLPEVNPTNPARTAPKPGTLLGVAIKTDHTDKPTTAEDWPNEANEEGDNQMDDKDENICHQRIWTKKESKN